MSDYSAVFLYSSTLGALPLDSNFARAARREKQHARRPNSTSDALHSVPARHSRSSSSHSQLSSSSSSALGPAASASVGPDSASLRLSPATSANTKKSTSTSATGSAASASAPASTSSNPFSPPPPLPHTQSHPPPPTPTQSSSTGSRASRTFSRLHRARLSGSASTVVDAAGRNANVQSPPEQDNNKQMTGFPTSRAESVSSASGHTPASSRTILSTDPSATDGLPASRPFVQRNGRTFLNDHTLVYPLPSDLTELHRQVLRTMLLIQVIGAPVLSPDLIKKPPQRVLEIGCGSGFWSNMCHHYFKSRGHGGLSFTGIDIAPLAPDNSSSTSDDAMKPSPDMQWKFVQHDLRQMPWPTPSEEYDLVMVKDVSYAVTNKMMQPFIEECVRMVRPGGTFEIWESDHVIRSLRPHVPTSTVSAEDAEEQAAAASLGAYVINPQTPLSVPSNNYIAEYNSWLTKALEKLDINPLPCTVIGPTLLQEYETLGDVRSRRIALPLSEFRWEKEGIGGVITTDSKPESKGKEASTPKSDKKTLTAGQIALRQTALLTQVQEMQALEPILRDVSGKSQDELDMWLTKMMNDLMDESGTSLGECLEFGAWYAKKKKVAA
ncbi:methyltransferase domain-containing protein [Trichoderma breve]|uniref:Methyltransferase domain-containing protein n=1 Tax=Trichoderma breve TaxID=2034170 RepID=A0A9W9BA10_9HYPO|nr:methyltransferase domain-containing protein [Trichoderma breve]KAJ4856530.1 methyltransferase domain-containing protein [Trichoderma breve]